MHLCRSTGCDQTRPGGTVLFGMSQAAMCWECEAPTESPVKVTLRTPARQFGPLTLCPACYHACFLPLARNGSGILDVEVREAGRRRR